MNATLEKSQPKSPPEPGFWNGPLGYPQAILVVVTAFLVGLFYHWRMPHGLHVPSRAAWAIGLGGAAVIAFISLRFREHRIVEWATGIPLAIVSTVGVCLVAAVGAVVPGPVLQAKFHMESVYSSWPFTMVMLVMMVNLIGVSARRCYPLNYRNLCFTLNHLGLTITILGGVLSAAGLERNNLVLEEGKPQAVAFTQDEKEIPLPFTATLDQFHMESFPPTLALAVQKPGTQDDYDVTPGEQFVKPGARERIGDYNVEVLDYYPRAVLMEGAWRSVPDMKAAAPAARVRVTDAGGQKITEGWVSSGSVAAEAAALRVRDGVGIFMPDPRPREFRSTVRIAYKGATQTHEIGVNQPVTVAGYRLYQLSYDEKMGAASTVSVLQVVRDRGLPVVYAGLYLMLAGAVLLLWNGVGTGVKVTKEEAQ